MLSEVVEDYIRRRRMVGYYCLSFEERGRVLLPLLEEKAVKNNDLQKWRIYHVHSLMREEKALCLLVYMPSFTFQLLNNVFWMLLALVGFYDYFYSCCSATRRFWGDKTSQKLVANHHHHSSNSVYYFYCFFLQLPEAWLFECLSLLILL